MGVLSASGGSSLPTGLSVWWRGEDRGAWLPRLSDGWGVEQGLGEAEALRGGAGGEEEVLDRELRHLETEEEELLTETGYCAALTSPEPERRLAPGRSIQRLNKAAFNTSTKPVLFIEEEDSGYHGNSSLL